MKVSELITLLQELPADAEVILQKDAEGNGYSPLSGYYTGHYTPETTWYGELMDEEEQEEDGVEDNCIVLRPVN